MFKSFFILYVRSGNLSKWKAIMSACCVNMKFVLIQKLCPVWVLITYEDTLSCLIAVSLCLKAYLSCLDAVVFFQNDILSCLCVVLYNTNHWFLLFVHFDCYYDKTAFRSICHVIVLKHYDILSNCNVNVPKHNLPYFIVS